MKLYSLVYAAVIAIAAVPAGTGSGAHAQATALRVLSSNGVKAVVEELQAGIERAIGRSLSIEFSTAASLTRAIKAGEPFDVALLTPALIGQLIAKNKIVAESRVEFARAGVGVGARSGTGKRDVGTPAALKQTLLAADSVAYTAGGQSRATIDAAFQALGITDAMRSQSVLLGPGEAPRAVATGEAELVMTLVSEIVPVPGLELLGPLPQELQKYVTFEGARGIAARDVRAADALLEYLAGPELAAALAKHGMAAVNP